MDFVAVPAGTTAEQALQIRGSDHDLELATADPFITVLGNATQARPAPAGRSLDVCYSTVSGIMSGHFFTRDPLVLNAALHGRGIAPAKSSAPCWLHQTANGLSNTHGVELR